MLGTVFLQLFWKSKPFLLSKEQLKLYFIDNPVL